MGRMSKGWLEANPDRNRGSRRAFVEVKTDPADEWYQKHTDAVMQLKMTDRSTALYHELALTRDETDIVLRVSANAASPEAKAETVRSILVGMSDAEILDTIRTVLEKRRTLRRVFQAG